jgi:hypothetical protein
MKLLALWIAVAVATGIGLSSRWQTSPTIWSAAAAIAILTGLLLIWRQRSALAWSFSFMVWIALGAQAIEVERVRIPANHVSRQMASGSIDTGVPLRYRGRLREDGDFARK